MWVFVLIVGFVIANVPSMFWGVWNGLSLLGLCICILSAGFILREEMEK
jgi:hypothetical protein